MSKEMSVKKDLKCVFNMPEKIKSEFDSEEEMAHSLPPYEQMDAYPVDEYEACPTNWMNGSDVASSYFVGVEEDKGMWLDFNECFYHTHDVAVVISIQGINPITGQTMVAEKALQLEQYHKKCPIHKTKFKQDRYCDKCGFKWPGQNYFATTGTPEMKMWLDGFRSSDGKVRQYIITADKIRSVAVEVMKSRGENPDNRVFAVGVAFYLSKHKKPYILERPEKRDDSHVGSTHMEFIGNVNMHNPVILTSQQVWGGNRVSDLDMYCENPASYGVVGGEDMSGLSIDSFVGNAVEDGSINCSSGPISSSSSTKGVSGSKGGKKKGTKKFGSKNMLRATSNVHAQNTYDRCKDETVYQLSPKKQPAHPVTPVKKLEIGAGALIKQRVYDDPKMIDYWEKEPAGMIYINYCDAETKKKILDAGRRADEKDGFLKDVKVGG